jgi:hypothetical protein
LTVTALTTLALAAVSYSAIQNAQVLDQFSENIVREAVTANGDRVAVGKYPTFGIDAKNGIDYTLKVDGCTSANRCQGLAMMACWKKEPTVTLGMVNAFNRAAYFGRAVLKENELCFFAYAITNGGVTRKYVKENIAVFNANAAVFVKNMEDKRDKP